MPAENRVSKIEKDRRIRAVLSWILGDALTHEIIDQCKLEFNVEERMARYYIKEARKRVYAIEEKNIEQEIELAVAQRQKLLRQLDKKYKGTPEGLRAQLNVHDSISKLKGHWVNKVDVTTKGKQIEVKSTVICLPDGTEITI